LSELRTWAEEKVKKDAPEFCLSDEKVTFVIELGAATAEAIDAYVQGGVPTMPHPAAQDIGPSRSMKSPGDQHPQPTPGSPSISNGQEFMYGFLYQIATPGQTAESVSAPVYFYSIGPAKPTPVDKPTFHLVNPCFETLLKFMAKNAKNGSQ
jgi:hypothetical protein